MRDFKNAAPTNNHSKPILVHFSCRSSVIAFWVDAFGPDFTLLIMIVAIDARFDAG